MLVDGYRFDYGPHILFTIDDEIRELIQDLLGENFHAQDREAYIYHHAHDLYTRFPFQAHLHGLPTAIVADCLNGLVRAVERQARGEFHPKNYLEWMRGFFGDGIADHLMVPYAKKIWTIEPERMDFSWIGRRVPTPDVERIIRGALSDEVDQVGATSQFWYTKRGGIEPLPRALAARVENIHLERTAVKIELPEQAAGLRRRRGRAVPAPRLLATAAVSAALHRQLAARGGACLRRPRVPGRSTASTSASIARTSRTSTGSTTTKIASRFTGCRCRPTSAPTPSRPARAQSPPKSPSPSTGRSTTNQRVEKTIEALKSPG